ncbi:unnamed protein product [Sphenostylis stenocarpa]|uniref:Uncharacterized protein n=1 Tax=Sphenostylis stenocarpa TaxID=92480 RepID=A0AA86SZG1_9FABA|nr:unnamed protein product [Sphenostylis stenocarpa]
MLQNAKLHALKNPRLLQIQHSLPPKFIDIPSPFHRFFLLLHRHEPPPPPPSPAHSLRSQLNLTAKNRHRADRNLRNYELRDFIATKPNSQRKSTHSVLSLLVRTLDKYLKKLLCEAIP